MTDEEKLSTLQTALSQPEGKYTHAQIQSQIDKLQGAPHPLTYAEQLSKTHQPGEGGYNREFMPAPPQGPTLGERVRSFGRGVGALGKFVGSEVVDAATRNPMDDFAIKDGTLQKSDNARRREAQRDAQLRQVVRGVDDSVGLGYLTKIADAIHARQGHGHPMAESAAADEKAAPDLRTGASAAGMFVPGVGNALGRATFGAGEGLFGAAPGFAGETAASSILPGTAAALTGYELSAPALAFAHADNEGHRLQSAGEAAMDPLGLILSGTVGTIAGAARGKAGSIRDPRKLSGRVLKAVEAAGPDAKINAFGEPVEGGLYETPEMQGHSYGRQGRHELANEEIDRIEAANKNRAAEAVMNYGKTSGDITDRNLERAGAAGPYRAERPSGTPATHEAMDQQLDLLKVKRGLPDEMIPESAQPIAANIQRLRGMLTQANAEVDVPATVENVRTRLGLNRLEPNAKKGGFTPIQVQQFMALAEPQDLVSGGARQVRTEDFITARKELRDMLGSASSPHEKTVYTNLLRAMEHDAQRIDPRLNQMDAAYAGALEPIDTSNELLFGKMSRGGDLTQGQRERGIRTLGNIGDETQTGTVKDPALKELPGLGPEYAAAANRMRARKAQDLLRRGDPEVSTSFEKNIALNLLRRNKLQNQVRVTLPASETMGENLTGSSGVGVDLATRAARKRGKKKREQHPAP